MVLNFDSESMDGLLDRTLLVFVGMLYDEKGGFR